MLRAALILLIPIVAAVIIFFPRRTSLDWMDASLQAIEYHNPGRLALLLDVPVTEAECSAFINTLEEEYWPLQRYTPAPGSFYDKDLEVIALLPDTELDPEMETTKIWVAVIDTYGRKGIFTLYASTDQKRILAMELIAEKKEAAQPE